MCTGVPGGAACTVLLRFLRLGVLTGCAEGNEPPRVALVELGSLGAALAALEWGRGVGRAVSGLETGIVLIGMCLRLGVGEGITLTPRGEQDCGELVPGSEDVSV